MNFGNGGFHTEEEAKSDMYANLQVLCKKYGATVRETMLIEAYQDEWEWSVELMTTKEPTINDMVAKKLGKKALR